MQPWRAQQNDEAVQATAEPKKGPCCDRHAECADAARPLAWIRSCGERALQRVAQNPMALTAWPAGAPWSPPCVAVISKWREEGAGEEAEGEEAEARAWRSQESSC